MPPARPGIRRRRAIGWRELLLLLEATLLLAVSSGAIALLPFKRVIAWGARPDGGDADPADLRKLRWATDAMARRVPWRAVCFQRALALRLMLRRRGIASVLHYGIAREDDGGLKAHVWLSVGDEVVIGGEEASRFACVGSFTGRQRD